ncbi:hypothetical protein AB0D08_38105, partial [Kitasatospora sp. NPDC048540]|uniref:hypothetical protein n=2 Tax=unclassified Kitasatospora TaxID=2633591 RepID=UPI00340AA7CC
GTFTTRDPAPVFYRHSAFGADPINHTDPTGNGKNKVKKSKKNSKKNHPKKTIKKDGSGSKGIGKNSGDSNVDAVTVDTVEPPAKIQTIFESGEASRAQLANLISPAGKFIATESKVPMATVQDAWTVARTVQQKSAGIYKWDIGICAVTTMCLNSATVLQKPLVPLGNARSFAWKEDLSRTLYGNHRDLTGEERIGALKSMLDSDTGDPRAWNMLWEDRERRGGHVTSFVVNNKEVWHFDPNHSSPMNLTQGPDENYINLEKTYPRMSIVDVGSIKIPFQ